MNQLYPHHVGHYLGMDVHDTYSICRSRKLQSNMVVTIEPGRADLAFMMLDRVHVILILEPSSGLYVPDSTRYPEGYRGIGIRIEDDVVIGSKDSGWSPIVLTAEAPKEMVDI